MRRNYPRIGIVEFGHKLFESGDLDPIYVALLGCLKPGPQQTRWLIAYWLFYDAGFASWASDQDDYWGALLTAAQNETLTPYGERWPRGSERRHFRGVKATEVADMIDAVVGRHVAQDNLAMFLYDTPRRSILESYRAGALGIDNGLAGDAVLEPAMMWLWFQLNKLRIPHKPTMAPDWFSLETVWCKHMSHLHGHYPLYNDIIEINHGVSLWEPYSDMAKAFQAAMPDRPRTKVKRYRPQPSLLEG